MKRLCSITTYTYTLHNVLRYQIDPLFPSVQPVGDPCPYLTKKYFFLVGYLLKYFKSVKILFRDKLSNFGLQSFGSPEVWHWHVARIISSQKIYSLYGLKHHIVEMRGGVTDAGQRTNIEDRATQPMEAGGWVSQFSGNFRHHNLLMAGKQLEFIVEIWGVTKICFTANKVNVRCL